MNSKKVLIYNKYLSTAGGGERASFDLSAALVACGYEVTFASDDPLFNKEFEEVTDKFGNYDNIKFKKFPSLNDLLATAQEYDLFINHTYSSFIPNPMLGKEGKKGIYILMFPRLESAKQIQALNTYDLILNISEFSEAYLDIYASEIEKLTVKHKTLVLPISDSHINKADIDIKNKEKLIINIGRYNVRGHSKCQLDVIKLFKELQKNGLLDGEWKLVCAGQLNKTPDNLLYFDSCINEAKDSNVEVLADLSFDELTNLYKRASILIQMTGFDQPFGESPEKCEHLGLVALDCLAYGVIPICYQRSGISAIIRHAIDGFLFADRDEIKSYIDIVAKQYNSSFHNRLLQNMNETKNLNTFDQYALNLKNVFLEHL